MDILLKYKKALIIIAIVLIVAEVVWAIYTLTRPVVKDPSSKSPTPSSVTQTVVTDSIASISLQGSTQVAVGEVFKVDIQLSTNSPTDGTDLIIKYDANVLEVVQTDKKAVTVGSIYQDYPVNTVDDKGLIVISGVTLNKGFKDQGLFGSMSFKAKTKGTTKISVDYTEKSTTDSNVTESASGLDILKSVNNLDITIN